MGFLGAFVGRPKVIPRNPAPEGSGGPGRTGKLTSMDKRRLIEATAQAAVLLALVALPAAWRVFDPGLALVLAAMLAVLTAGTYALHAVTFDCFRLTGNRDRAHFTYTQREE